MSKSDIYKIIIEKTPEEKITELTPYEYVNGGWYEKDGFLVIYNNSSVNHGYLNDNDICKLNIECEDNEWFWVNLDKYDVCLTAYKLDDKSLKQFFISAIQQAKKVDAIDLLRMLDDTYDVDWKVLKEKIDG